VLAVVLLRDRSLEPRHEGAPAFVTETE
jgi:hypothetical protein